MTTPSAADLNAPPGGGPNAVVVATTNPAAPAAPAAPVVPETPPLIPEVPPAAPAAPAPANTPVADLGDPGLNVAADYFVNTLGLSLDSPEIVEAAKGNYEYLTAKIAQLGDKAKGAEVFVNLAKEAQSRVAERAKAQLDDITKTVHTAVGGAENWTTVVNFAQANLSQADLGSVRETLNRGGIVAEAMAKHLLALASAHPNVSVQGLPVSDTSVPTAALTAATPLTPSQYRTEYRKLVEQHGITGVQRGAGADALKALNARFRPA